MNGKTDRVILHCDCNSYYASVECVDHPEWKTVPMAVSGDPKNRHGVILAKNEAAKAFGVKTAQTVWQAKEKCPQLLLVPPHHEKYEQFSRRINAIYEDYTDQVEPFSIDESWLDVTGSQHLFGTGTEIADTLRRRIREEVGVTISVGVSFNKTFAKMGSDYKKPDATTVITRENFRDLLWPLPVEDMLFVGKRAAETLRSTGIATIGDLVQAGSQRLQALLGKPGAMLWRCAAGLDDSPVKHIGEQEEAKSISHSFTFRQDLVGKEQIRAGLLPICDRVGSRLRSRELFCTTVTVQIKDQNLRVISRQRSLGAATQSTRTVYETACALVLENWQMGRPIRMLTVGVSGLTRDGFAQLDLFTDAAQNEKQLCLERTMDDIRRRFGKDALLYGSTVEKKRE